MKKVAIVNQRYGLEVNGGSEAYTRMIAEKLKERCDVEVLTTCALEYTTWANYYKEGVEEINGVKVQRFRTTTERNQKEFDKLTVKVLNPELRTKEMEQQWVTAQGPYCPDLIQYIKDNKEKYDVFIFVTYLYYLTAIGMPEVADKAILIPTAHDEPFLQFDIYNKVFTCPKGYIFLTDEEQQLVYQKFHTENIFARQAAVGIEVPENINAQRFIDKYHIEHPFMIYVGRIDEGKNCHWMFRYFMEYKKRNPESELQLVLMGKSAMDIPKHKDIISLGFVSEEDKYDGIAASQMLILPSEYESLSISVLEAMDLKKCVLVNGKCEVLKGHCIKSNGGLYYNDYFEFEATTNFILTHLNERKKMEENAHQYVKENYKWNVVLQKLDEVINYVAVGKEK